MEYDTVPACVAAGGLLSVPAGPDRIEVLDGVTSTRWGVLSGLEEYSRLMGADTPVVGTGSWGAEIMEIESDFGDDGSTRWLAVWWESSARSCVSACLVGDLRGG